MTASFASPAATRAGLPLPVLYGPEAFTRIYAADVAETAAKAAAWRSAHGVPHRDGPKVALFVIDPQRDFTVPDGALFVQGAPEDCSRIATLVLRNMDVFDRIWISRDSHSVGQVFHPAFWADASGSNPAPGTVIRAEDVRNGKWSLTGAAVAQAPVGPDAGEWARRQVLHYLDKLEETGRYSLVVWPYHCIDGSGGELVHGAVAQAALFHSLAVGRPFTIVPKGSSPWTEAYSVFGPEFADRWDGALPALDGKRYDLVDGLYDGYDEIVFVGEASSHCLAWSVDDCIRLFAERDPASVRRITVLSDCTSPVVVPGVIDFTPQAQGAMERWKAAGLRVETTRDFEARFAS
jgi:nicotinamidase-related amidase